MPREWSEQFSQQRMDKCVGVFQKIVSHWAKTNRFDCRVVIDESPEGKTLDQLAQTYFSVGVGDDLTDLPFLDTLVVVKMLADHNANVHARRGRKQPKKWKEKYRVKTSFSEDEAFAILNDIVNKLGIEIRNRGKLTGRRPPVANSTDEVRGPEVFEAFPDIKALGKERLQALCDEWLGKPTAKEFAVAELFVMEEHGKLTMSFRVEVTHKLKDREEYHFPMDSLLNYIADHGIESEADREQVKADIVSKRQEVGSDVYQRFLTDLGPELAVFLTCKNPSCQDLMMTQFKGRKCETVTWGPEQVECPCCHEIYEYDQDDMHFGSNE